MTNLNNNKKLLIAEFRCEIDQKCKNTKNFKSTVGVDSYGNKCFYFVCKKCNCTYSIISPSHISSSFLNSTYEWVLFHEEGGCIAPYIEQGQLL